MKKYSTQKVADRVSALFATVDPDEVEAILRQEFPGIDDDQLLRAFEIRQSDLEASHRERLAVIDGELAQGREVRKLFEGLPDGATLEEATKIKAKKGDPYAIELLAFLNSRGTRVRDALLDAAARKHPDYEVIGNGERRKLTGEWAEDEGSKLIDWFQRTHPAEARAIEDSIE